MEIDQQKIKTRIQGVDSLKVIRCEGICGEKVISDSTVVSREQLSRHLDGMTTGEVFVLVVVSNLSGK